MTMIASGLITGGLSIVSGIFGMSAAKKREAAAARAKDAAQKKLTYLEDNRQEIINPYEGIKDLSGMAKDLSGNLNNPFAQLGVATQAAEIQMEQSDIALANTLDTLRSTGASAGGATALAQAALQSKKGVSASIEQQEASNEKARAQGEQRLQSQKMSEQQRLQNIAISEGQRVQNADVSGKSFVYGQQETRDVAQLNRLQSQVDGAAAAESQASADRTGALTGMISGVSGAVTSAFTPPKASSVVPGRFNVDTTIKNSF